MAQALKAKCAALHAEVVVRVGTLKCHQQLLKQRIEQAAHDRPNTQPENPLQG